MRGYWALPQQTAKGFFKDPDGSAWYRTGDIVTEADDACYTYRGRRDRMVKRRGYRVELGEIEAGLYRHAKVKEAAVLAFADELAGVSITAFLISDDAKPPPALRSSRSHTRAKSRWLIQRTSPHLVKRILRRVSLGITF